MKTYTYNRIAVKIGSNVLTLEDGTIDLKRMSALVNQIAKLHKDGVEIVLISSGAVAFGRNELKLDKKMSDVSARQVFSAIGQTKLMNHYSNLFQEHGIICGQILTTKENFGSRRHYLNQRNCVNEMLNQGVMPIVNENDTISVTELMFTDNDELSGLIATMIDAEALIILSNIDGIYNDNPEKSTAEVIRKVNSNNNITQFVRKGKSTFGRGGILTKMNIASKVAEEGITVIVANGNKENILPDLLKKESDAICTEFIANSKGVSSVKKWIAHSNSFAKGEVHINKGAVDALNAEKANSLLFVGITKITGEFEKDDIIQIIDEKGTQIGVGKTNYDSEEAFQLIGEKDHRPLVHYDYLYLD